MEIGFPRQQQYEQREASEHYQRMQEVEKAPLSERLEAYQEFAKALADDPETVAERVGWVLNGSYGKGAYDKAWDIAKSPRMNRVAALTQMAAALEWSCTGVYARKAWTRLTQEQKDKVDKLVAQEINEQGQEVAGFQLLKGV